MLRPSDDHGPLMDRLAHDKCVVCPRCGYNLHNLPTGRCPECGASVLMWELPDATRPLSWRVAAVDELGFWVVALAHLEITVGVGVSWIVFERQAWITAELVHLGRRALPNYLLVLALVLLPLLPWRACNDEWHIRWFRPQVASAIASAALVPVHLLALASLWW